MWFIDHTCQKYQILIYLEMKEPAIVQGMYIFKQPGVGKLVFVVEKLLCVFYLLASPSIYKKLVLSSPH